MVRALLPLWYFWLHFFLVDCLSVGLQYSLKNVMALHEVVLLADRQDEIIFFYFFEKVQRKIDCK